MGVIRVRETDGAYWSHTSRPEFASGHTVSVWEYTDSWLEEERHPDGDELAMVLSGRIRMLLTPEGGGATQRCELGGLEALVVPRGSWHTVDVLERCMLLFVTPVPKHTEHRLRAGSASGAQVPQRDSPNL